ncbi:6-phosphogluconate phosphatase [Alphaproteobacteria bacterium SO-S41]|nr:6-phosphogluconate phosphatase [Alphaproteobacteria bacterium SO-S41]
MTDLKPDLVIFDCDGVLVDSEAIANETLAGALSEWGLAMTGPEARARWIGRSMTTVEAELRRELGDRLPEGWLEEVEARDFAIFRARLEAVPAVRGAIEAVQAAGIATCVASSGSHAKMDVTLGVTGLKPLFEGRIYSSRQVARGKPHPDLFLFAAAEMGIAPEQAVVIEDSPAGVTGAVAAGMRVLGYAGDPLTERAALAAAGAELFEDMRDVPRLLGLG